MRKIITWMLIIPLTLGGTFYGCVKPAAVKSMESLSIAASKVRLNPQDTVDDVIDQGILYVKKKNYTQGRRYLAKALDMNGGSESFKRALYHSQAALKLSFPEEAFAQANLAKKLAEGKKQKQKAEENYNEVRSLYGCTKLKMLEQAEKEGRSPTGYLHIKAKRGILHKGKQKALNMLKERLSQEEITLPATICLPVGTYEINAVNVEIENADKEEGSAGMYGSKPAAKQIVLAHMEEEPDEGMSTWAIVGIGVAALAVGFFVSEAVREEEAPDPEANFEVGF